MGDMPNNERPTVTDASSASEAAHPARVGPYRILSVLGQGGMGVVYVAEQDKPRRRIALKLIRFGVVTPDLLRRFEHEAQVLGRLQHPGIAQIYEAGTADTGHGRQPYFAMELVKGQPLTDYAYAQKLGTHTRLELIAKVCDAVQHAHQKGVIHRDLKPGNILVSGGGQPKILDFGVARATEADIQAATLQTDVGQLVGTLPYMSPEQAAGDPHELDTRSDVYGLGVVAYELLSGRLPYDVREKMIHEAVQVIREEAPTPLSSANRVCRGDVETIVAKALEKDRSRRYQSASELAADIRRYLNDEPIVARPPSAAYRLRKFAKRNRTLVGAGAAVLFVVFLGAIGTTVGLVRAVAAREAEAEQRKLAEENEQKARDNEALALQRAAETNRVAGVLASMLRTTATDAEELGWTIARDVRKQVRAGLERTWVVGDGGEMRRRTADEIAVALTQYDAAVGLVNPTEVARQMMDVSVLRPAGAAIAKEFADITEESAEQPQVQAQLFDTLGTVYMSLGQYDLAEPHLRRALDLRRRLHGDDHPDTLSSINSMGALLHKMGKYGEAMPYYAETLQRRHRVLGDDDPDVLRSMNNMGALLWAMGKHGEALPHWREALDGFRSVLGDDHPDTLNSINNMGALLLTMGKSEEAEPYFREVLERKRRVLGDDDQDTVITIGNMGALLYMMGRYNEAEPYFREALERRRRVLGDDHPETLLSITNMGGLLGQMGRHKEAEPYCREALEYKRRVLGTDHPNTIDSMGNLGVLLSEMERYDEAEPYNREALERSRRIRGNDHPSTLRLISSLGALLGWMGESAAAAPLYREALEGRRRVLGDDHPDTLTSIDNMGWLLQRMGRYDEAELHYREALERKRRVLGGDHPGTLTSINNLAHLLAAVGRYEEAEQYSRQALEGRRCALGDDHPDTLTSLHNRAELLITTGRSEEAQPLALESHDRHVNRYGVEHPKTTDAVRLLVTLYAAWHKAEPGKGYDAQAAEWRAKLEKEATQPRSDEAMKVSRTAAAPATQPAMAQPTATQPAGDDAKGP